MKGLLHLLLIIGIAYAALVVLVYWRQASMVYLPIRALAATPAAMGLAFESLRIPTDDGETLHGWFIPATTSRGTLLLLHGNAGNISHRLESIATFHRLGLDVLIVDYRGYGESTGTPTEEGTYRDAMAAWHYLTQTRQIDPGHIVVFGRSLGAAVAARLATRVAPAAVILESAFTSALDVANEYYFWLPTHWIVRFRYDTRADVARIHRPVLIAHSLDDEIIAFRHAQQLYAAANPPKEMLVMRGGHNDGFVVTGPAYVDGLARFVSANLPSRTP